MIRIAAFLAALATAALIVWALATHFFPATHAPTAASVDVRAQFPDREENESATRFLATAARLDDRDLRAHRNAMIEYIRKEVASGTQSSAPAPATLAGFLARNAAVIRTIRAQLASNPAPVWKLRANELLDAPEPELIGDLQLFTMFAAAALSDHSNHHDPAAWSDLGTIWILARSLWSRPEIPSVLIALSGSRMVAAVAAKLDPPTPLWWQDFIDFDPRPPMNRALSYQAWFLREQAQRYPVGEPENDAGFREAMRRTVEPLVRPIRIIQADEQASQFREMARSIASSDPCNALSPSLRNWQGSIQRLNRFMVEREGATKLLMIEQQRLTSGTWPPRIDEHSICRSAHWNYRRVNEGIELSFSRPIPPPPTRIVTPLVYRR